MKTFACVLFVVFVSVTAEPVGFKNARYQFQRQEASPSEEREQTTPKGDEAPYAPAGFKPAKPFNLPSRQEARPPSTSYGVPADSYGAPLNTYSAPNTEYGVPKNLGAEEKGENDEESKKGEDAENLEVRGIAKEEKKELLREGEEDNESEIRNVISQQGAYYVLLPDSQLQRVQFQTQNDIRNMAYTARLQYRNEDRAPVYVYTAAVPEYQRAAYVQLF